MKISILTLFPGLFDGFINESIIKRAINKKTVEIEIINIRDFSKLNNSQVDDTPYGGGAGMVLMVEPVVDAINSVKTADSFVVLMNPSAPNIFKESIAYELAAKNHLILVCGHYEGIDERILNYVDYELSIGDFILTGGELPSMVISDAVIRLLDGVINNDSLNDESFTNNLLDYPTYTKPASYDGLVVPDVLLSGNHQKIAEWRKNQQIEKTKKNRPDLLN